MSELSNRGQELAIEIRCKGHTDDAPIPKEEQNMKATLSCLLIDL